MYKDDNKICQQQNVLHMNEMLERVTHFQTSFSVGIQHCLNGEITAEAHTVYTTIHRSIVNFRYFRT